MRAKRRALTKADVTLLSEKIRGNVFALISGEKNICVFLSAFKEPDTSGIIGGFLEMGCSVAVPVTHTDSVTLTLSYIDGVSGLKKGAYGILEPSQIKPADENDIDIILVPGLAFDRSGGRMGFGMGYYDRFLKNSRAVKIGLCYDFQLLDSIPSESHDVPMDFIITEKEILKVR